LGMGILEGSPVLRMGGLSRHADASNHVLRARVGRDLGRAAGPDRLQAGPIELPGAPRRWTAPNWLERSLITMCVLSPATRSIS